MNVPRIGLIARADNGGIAAQSQEFAKALPIEATLIVDLGDKGRGPNYPFDWPIPHYVDGPDIQDRPTVEAFLDRVDVVLSVETFYGTMVIDLARRRNIPTVRYANPELYKNEEESHVVLPTEWEMDRIPHATFIPQGISTLPNAKEFVRDRPAKNLLHVSAPAMLDRNGTADFFAALAHTHNSFNVTIVGQDNRNYFRHGKHNYITYSEFRENRFEYYTEDIDLAILPRRYGGLSLPMLEAASFGIPTLTTDLSPQNKWFTHDNLIPTIHSDLVNMVGGKFPVYSCDIPALSYRLDRYATQSLGFISRQAIGFAEHHSWKRIAPLWLEYFATIC